MSRLGDGEAISVLIVSAFDPLEGEGRELIRYPLLAKALTDLGAKVTFLSSSFDHFSKSQREVPSRKLPYQLELIPTPSYTKNISLKRIWSHYIFGKNLLRHLNESQSAYDVIISAFPPISANVRLSRWAERHDTPFLVDIQDAWPEAFLVSLPPFWGKIMLQPLFRQRKKTFSQAKKLISVSQDYLSELHISPGKSAVFPLGAHFPDLTFSKKEDDSVKLILLAGSDKLPFLNALLEQIAQLPLSFELMLVGRSQAFSKIKSSPRIHIFHEVSEKQKHELLSEADIGLVLNDPKLKSRMPNKVFSYLSYGLPIISNLSGGELEEILETEDWGLSCEQDLSDFSVQVQKLIHQKLQLDKQRIFGQAKNRFDKGLIYENYARFIVGQKSK